MGRNGKGSATQRKTKAGKKASRSRKVKEPPVDGFGPKDKKNLYRVVRQVWSWSHPSKLVRKRSMGADGFPRCENKKCEHKGEPVPKVFVDHIDPVGEIAGPNWLDRMFIPSNKLQALCKQCHDGKTRKEKAKRPKQRFTDGF